MRARPLNITHYLLGALSALGCSIAVAGLSPEQVARLGNDLTPFGATGCQLSVSPDLLYPFTADPVGQAQLWLTIPNLTSLTGQQLFDQFLILDPGANPFGLTATNAIRARIGG